MDKIKQKVINFINWILKQVKDWHNLIILAIVAPALFLFCIFLVTLALFFTDGKIHLIISASTVLAFWMGPFTPFWPLCIAITLGIRKFIDSIWRPKQLNKKEDRK